MKRLILGAAIAASLTACTSVSFNKDGSYSVTQPNGTVCTHQGAMVSCSRSPEQLAAAQQQILQRDGYSNAERVPAANPAGLAQAQADREQVQAWQNSPEGKASAADWEAKQAEWKRKRKSAAAAGAVAHAADPQWIKVSTNGAPLTTYLDAGNVQYDGDSATAFLKDMQADGGHEIEVLKINCTYKSYSTLQTVGYAANDQTVWSQMGRGTWAKAAVGSVGEVVIDGVCKARPN
ncbi:hypothetical protein [Paraburkholderia rhynchosiae]|uniref:Lipoprotein n=1 Tax=Paraburkholderia rhynchosiae TaxID=487049 RepID=A0A2N7WHP4_9BURK|nr:hypothetical protein [Paraburkholderia rhynchosiae]PMS28884.1 hypothetical protein C0Z16_20870 [Paraburkholderia rhynchosiae]CAB3665523.1 hypothetical protein LMG27174_01860 [Paraburkholderia rhynchosiae]